MFVFSILRKDLIRKPTLTAKKSKKSKKSKKLKKLKKLKRENWSNGLNMYIISAF